MSDTQWPLWEVFVQGNPGIPHKQVGCMLPMLNWRFKTHAMFLLVEMKELAFGLSQQIQLLRQAPKIRVHFSNHQMIRLTDILHFIKYQME